MARRAARLDKGLSARTCSSPAVRRVVCASPGRVPQPPCRVRQHRVTPRTRGATTRGGLLWVTFLGRARKVTSCRAAPGLLQDDSVRPRQMQPRGGEPIPDASDLSPFVNVRTAGTHSVPADALLGDESRYKRHRRQRCWLRCHDHPRNGVANAHPCSASD